MFARTVRNRRGWVLSLLGLLSSAGVLVPVLIIVGIALAVLIFGLPAFIGLLISPLRMIGILLLILAGAWLFVSKDFKTSGIIGAVGLLILLSGQFGLFAASLDITGNTRAQSELVGETWYTHPAGTDETTGFSWTSPRSGSDMQSTAISDTSCLPPTDIYPLSQWEWKGYCTVSAQGLTFTTRALCEGDLLTCTVPLANFARPYDTNYAITAYSRWKAPAALLQPTGAAIGEPSQAAPPLSSSLWARFLAWFRGVFA